MGVDLVVKTADHAITGEALVVLYKAKVYALFAKGLFVIGFEKMSPVVFIRCGLEDQQAGDRGRSERHAYLLMYCSVQYFWYSPDVTSRTHSWLARYQSTVFSRPSSN